MYFYSAFGLRIGSEIMFPELVSIESSPQWDVTIEMIDVIPNVVLAAARTNNPWISQNQFYFRVPEVAEYFATNGEMIKVRCFNESSIKSVRIYLLCNAMAAIIHQRGLIPMHASGFVSDNGVVLLIGESGAGKSTTIRYLKDKGNRIFTDDVCVLDMKERNVLGIPSYPMLKLWHDSIKLLDLKEYFIQDNKIWPDIEKYGVLFHAWYINEWMHIKGIIVLEVSDKIDNVQYCKLDPFEAFKTVGKNTYRIEYVEPMNLNTRHFHIITALINQAFVYKIVRPSNTNSLSDVAAAINTIIN